MSYVEKIVESYAKENNINITKEYRFHSTRRWRFDFTDVDNKIAVEFEGGIWSTGRHVRGKGYRNDTIKYNAAITLGWRVLRYCSVDDIAEFFIDDYNKILNFDKENRGRKRIN